MKYRWSFAVGRNEVCQQLSSELSLSPLLAQCLINRGVVNVSCAGDFLQPRLKHLSDPFLIPFMDAAVDRLLVARDQKEPLVVFGDYDVDGVTSTALLADVLGRLGWVIHCYLPHRRDEGYGLTQEGVRNCLEKHPVKLVLAVDCGSTAVETIAALKALGVDVIVLDHHQISTPAPASVALVNPRINPETVSQPFYDLCSVGLSFKLAHALLKRLRDLKDPAALALDLKGTLDLVALGTIADLVPLTRENRILTSAGLERLQWSTRPGLVALKEVAQCRGAMGSYEVGFMLTPRLNASGRLETAEESLRLLLSRGADEAVEIARSLDARNRERQSIERGIAETVVATIRPRFNPQEDYVIVEGNAGWHVGVVGIVASRVVAEFHRPTIILGGDGAVWRGSGRSIEGFDLAAALRQCDDLLARHGGHAMAAGMSIDPVRLDEFRSRLNALAHAALSPEQLQPELRLDAQVSLADLDLERVEELSRLGPTGQGNPPVRLAVGNLMMKYPPQRMGRENQHVKLRVTDGARVAEAVWWNCGKAELPQGPFDLAFTPQVNEYNGRRTVQLKVLDWRE
jgi:single-stranded-DNA-specific exonuclease